MSDIVKMHNDIQKICSSITYQHNQYIREHKIGGNFKVSMKTTGGDWIITIIKKNTIKYWLGKLTGFIF